MRVVFLLLVLLNLAFFAWSRYLAPPPAGTDPRPLAQQIEPGLLRILTPAEVAAMAPPAKPKPAASVAAGGAPAAPVPPAPAPATICLDWGPLAPADAERAAQALAPLALGARLSQLASSGASTWWVFIPPQPNLQAAQKKAAELKALGVSDYFIVEDTGPDRWAVSLGVFRSEAAARAHLEALRAKKVHSAELAPYASQGERLWYEIRDVDAALRAKLEPIARGFPGSGLQDCSPPAASQQ